MVGYSLLPGLFTEEQLAPALLQYCAELPVDKDSLRIHSTQISFVFCTFNFRRQSLDKPPPSSVLLFGKNASIPSNELLREQLLFYSYSEQRLEVLGHLSLEQYNAGYLEYVLTLGDVDQPQLQLAYPCEPETVRLMRELKPYYEYRPTGTPPSKPVRYELVSQEMDATLGLDLAAAQRLQRISQAELSEYMREKFLKSPEHRPLAFAYSLLVAGIEEDYAKLVLKREALLLGIRLGRYWTNERARAVFCAQWFPDHVQVRQLDDPRSQFPLFPSPMLLDEAEVNRLDREFTDRCKASLPLGSAMPSLAFSIQPAYRSSLLSEPLFSAQELPVQLAACLEHRLRNRISTLQLEHSLALFRRFYMPMALDIVRYTDSVDARVRLDQEFLQVTGNPERLSKIKASLAEIPRLPRQHFLLPDDRGFVLAAVCMHLYSYLGVYAEMDAVYDNSEYNAMRHDEEKGNLRAGPAAALEIDHPLPETRNAALQYSLKYWPACLRRLLELSEGERHLTYEERLAASGMLKSFGYTLQQAEQMWDHFFSETTVYSASFKQDEYGTVPKTDYTKDKQGGCGNCKTMSRKGHCPFGDLEEIGTLCAADLHRRTGRTALYPISNPAQYFRMSFRASANHPPGSPRSDE